MPSLDIADAVYMVMYRESTRVYVGMTTQTVAKRWKQHSYDAKRDKRGRYFCGALRKYGADAFDVYVIESGIPRDQILARERHYVAALRANEPGRGFNLTTGGEAPPSSDLRVRAKISAAQKGRALTPEWRANVAESLRGHKRSAEEIEKSAAKRRGRKRTDETRELLRLSHLGHKQSEDTKTKRADWMRAHWADPEVRQRRATAVRDAWARRKGTVA